MAHHVYAISHVETERCWADNPHTQQHVSSSDCGLWGDDLQLGLCDLHFLELTGHHESTKSQEHKDRQRCMERAAGASILPDEWGAPRRGTE